MSISASLCLGLNLPACRSNIPSLPTDEVAHIVKLDTEAVINVDTLLCAASLVKGVEKIVGGGASICLAKGELLVPGHGESANGKSQDSGFGEDGHVDKSKSENQQIEMKLCRD
jgi:hypothetical protein